MTIQIFRKLTFVVSILFLTGCVTRQLQLENFNAQKYSRSNLEKKSVTVILHPDKIKETYNNGPRMEIKDARKVLVRAFKKKLNGKVKDLKFSKSRSNNQSDFFIEPNWNPSMTGKHGMVGACEATFEVAIFDSKGRELAMESNSSEKVTGLVTTPGEVSSCYQSVLENLFDRTVDSALSEIR